jgi:hypothetical protein
MAVATSTAITPAQFAENSCAGCYGQLEVGLARQPVQGAQQETHSKDDQEENENLPACRLGPAAREIL